MTLTKEEKQDIIGKHGRTESDTGSPQVQVAMLTRRINQLTEHLRSIRRITIPVAACSSSSGAAAVLELPAAEGSGGLSGPDQGAGSPAIGAEDSSGVEV